MFVFSCFQGGPACEVGTKLSALPRPSSCSCTDIKCILCHRSWEDTNHNAKTSGSPSGGGLYYWYFHLHEQDHKQWKTLKKNTHLSYFSKCTQLFKGARGQEWEFICFSMKICYVTYNKSQSKKAILHVSSMCCYFVVDPTLYSSSW